MASTDIPEARELSLVGKVELRIALTDTDTKLESILKTYLAPLLLKLGSDHMSVRNKVRGDPAVNRAQYITSKEHVLRPLNSFSLFEC